MSKKRHVTEAMFNKVHKTKERVGNNLTDRELGSLVGFHQTTISRILGAENFEDYKYKLANYYHKYQQDSEDTAENNTDNPTPEETAVVDLGADMVKQLTRIANALEEFVKEIK